MSVVLSICVDCKLMKSEKTGEYTRHNWCPAFPDGIPLEHMFRSEQGEECNNGITFVAK